ncbi:MAG: alpha/beta hydrolase [Bryobacterales bacterium]|jgi:pimeloyl-ACP methyl ester carboxylesterase|nr:alpha/beta hydrolase [Bryobacterales bacterium]
MQRTRILLGLFLVATLGLLAAPPTPDGWTEGYVMANGIRIHYWRTGGDKPPMVLAHGSSDDGLCWVNFAKDFADDYDIILYDARGHGRTDPPTPYDPPDAQADDLAGLIQALRLDKPVVMGHSMGSASTAWFAAKHPDVPRAVILEDPYLGPRRNLAGANPEQRRAQILARNNFTEAQLVAECMKNTPQWGQSECAYWAPSKRMHHPNTSMGTAAMRPAMSELFPRITAATLILKADTPAQAQVAEKETAALLARGTMMYISGAGHNVRRDRKAETVAAVRQFLKGL